MAQIDDEHLEFLREVLSAYEDDNGQYQFDPRWKALLQVLFGVDTLNESTFR
jgi:hypothetical protein